MCTLADGFVTVRGERSRFFGADAAADSALSSATKNVSSDLYFRGVREAGTMERLMAQPAPRGPSRAVKDLTRGFAAGYNAWLRKNRITDPACRGADWVRPVSVQDVTARNFALAVLGGQGRAVDDITAAQPPAPTTPATAAPDARDTARAARELFAADSADMGSNAVAFSGATTANGRGLLLGNPHYPWQGGRRFLAVAADHPRRTEHRGRLTAWLGHHLHRHNAQVAWSHTVATGVTLDLHQLTLDPADPTTYLVDGKPERMTRREVTVAVKEDTPVTRTQWWTRYGPVQAVRVVVRFADWE